MSNILTMIEAFEKKFNIGAVAAAAEHDLPAVADEVIGAAADKVLPAGVGPALVAAVSSSIGNFIAQKATPTTDAVHAVAPGSSILSTLENALIPSEAEVEAWIAGEAPVIVAHATHGLAPEIVADATSLLVKHLTPLVHELYERFFPAKASD